MRSATALYIVYMLGRHVWAVIRTCPGPALLLGRSVSIMCSFSHASSLTWNMLYVARPPELHVASTATIVSVLAILAAVTIDPAEIDCLCGSCYRCHLSVANSVSTLLMLAVVIVAIVIPSAAPSMEGLSVSANSSRSSGITCSSSRGHVLSLMSS